MADTQRDGRDTRPDAGVRKPGQSGATEGGRRVPWRVEGARPDGGEGPQRPRLFGPRFWLLLLGLLVLNWVLSALLVRPPERTEVPYTLFRAQVEAGNVTSVTGIEDAIAGQFKNPVRVPVADQDQEVTRFSSRRPEFAADDKLWELLTEKNVEVSAEPPPGPSLLERALLGFGPTLLLVGLFVLLAGGPRGAPVGAGRHRPVPGPRYEPETGRRTTFADVAGIDEVEDELVEIVDFLPTPTATGGSGAWSPRGCCWSGRPAPARRCWPGPSPARPRCRSSSCGLGVHRDVRGRWRQPGPRPVRAAKKAAPAIVFIDELDAIGRARGGSLSAAATTSASRR